MTAQAPADRFDTLTASADYWALCAQHAAPPGAPCPAVGTPVVRDPGTGPLLRGYVVEAHPLVNLDTGELAWAALALTLHGTVSTVRPRRPALHLATSRDWAVAHPFSPSRAFARAVRETAAWLGKRTGALSTEDVELLAAVDMLTRAGAR